MKDRILDKLNTPHGHLDCADLTADEKKRLYALLTAHGMSQSKAYERLFAKGFDEWELQGIDRIKADFCTEGNLPQLLAVGEGFYSAIPAMQGLKVKLVNLMAQLGMEHRNTVDKRFDADDWRPWERIGIRTIISDFSDGINSTPATDNEASL